ncbi:MAG: DUF4266 domain-containing protein [Crocinitomicaceae bacterium]|nr:DUF4266 domain-containing protein [Crocinitomicaceae bacterium]
MKSKILLMSILATSITSCTPVKNYQKMHLNDKDMVLKPSDLETFESSFEMYREGAAGTTGGSTGGGCGCN